MRGCRRLRPAPGAGACRSRQPALLPWATLQSWAPCSIGEGESHRSRAPPPERAIRRRRHRRSPRQSSSSSSARSDRRAEPSSRLQTSAFHCPCSSGQRGFAAAHGVSFQGRDVTAAHGNRAKISDALRAALRVTAVHSRLSLWQPRFLPVALVRVAAGKTGGFASPSLDGFALDNSESLSEQRSASRAHTCMRRSAFIAQEFQLVPLRLPIAPDRTFWLSLPANQSSSSSTARSFARLVPDHPSGRFANLMYDPSIRLSGIPSNLSSD